mgnify:CR=1 FL=1
MTKHSKHKATDKEIVEIAERLIRKEGSFTLRTVAEISNAGDIRVRRVLLSHGLKSRGRYGRQKLPDNATIGFERDATLVSEAKEAIEQEGLDTPFGKLLSVITGVPLEHLIRLSSGTARNTEVLQRTGAIQQSTYRSYRPSSSLVEL